MKQTIFSTVIKINTPIHNIYKIFFVGFYKLELREHWLVTTGLEFNYSFVIPFNSTIKYS